MSTEKINGRLFKKSNHSVNLVSAKCVSVSISDRDVLVKRFGQDSPILNFTRDEWDAFLKGIKSGEFDLDENRQ